MVCDAISDIVECIENSLKHGHNEYSLMNGNAIDYIHLECDLTDENRFIVCGNEPRCLFGNNSAIIADLRNNDWSREDLSMIRSSLNKIGCLVIIQEVIDFFNSISDEADRWHKFCRA